MGVHVGIKFEGKRYLKTHGMVMKIIAHMDADPYHGPQLRKLLQTIAMEGL